MGNLIAPSGSTIGCSETRTIEPRSLQGENMSSRLTNLVFGMARFCIGASGFLVLMQVDATAQQKYPIRTEAAAAQSKYIQQHAIDVGDVPGHQVRVYEIQRTGTEVTFSGIKSKENWSRGFSDYTNGSGPTTGYGSWMLEDGSKVYYRYSGTSQTTISADGSKKGAYTGVSYITGGTGKFSKIRGVIRDWTKFDMQAGYNESSGEGEYWFEE